MSSAISPLLDALTCELVGFCLDILADGEELWPTLAYCGPDGDANCMTFDGDELDNCLEAAREQVRGLPATVTCYAIAYDGFVQDPDDGGSVDALLVEFGERAAATAYSLYVAYARENGGADFVCGEPLAAGEEPLLLR